MTSTRSLREKKSNKIDWSELKQAREGKISLLDNLNFGEDDNVYNVVDEDEYAVIVENRRKQNDFVVDDDGIGYYDDGEEHLGIIDDAYEVKKRLAQAADEADLKTAKKARKLAESSESIQKNTLMNFVRPGVKPTNKTSINKVNKNTSALDIDSLLDNLDSENKPNNSFNHRRNLSNKPPIRMNKPLPRKALDESFLNSYISGPDVSSNTQTNDYMTDNNNMPFDDNHFDNYNENDINSQPTSYIETFPETTNNETKSNKISLSTTTKKFVIKEDIQMPDSKFNSQDVFSGFSDFTQSQSTVDSSNTSAGSISPDLWLEKSINESNEESEEYVKMFWIDSCEIHGTIYLFGKVKLLDNINTNPSQYVSCCVAVNGCERNLFALPKATEQFKPDGSPVRSSMVDVYNEITKVLVPDIIPRSQGQSFRCKQVKRDYAFEYNNIPRELTDYMKIVYSSKHPLPSSKQCQGGQHIERIFGSSISTLEWFLLKRKIMGPCWLKIKSPKLILESISWCKLELTIDSPKLISKIDEKLSNPPLTTLTISIKTVVNPSTHLHEIVMISGLLHTKIDCDCESDNNNTKLMKRYVYMRQLGLSCGNNYPSVYPHDLSNECKKYNYITTFPNERALLSSFLTRIHLDDPDVIVSHNLLGFELDIILSRCMINKIPSWSRLSRLRKSKYPKNANERDLTSGRLLCDTYKSSKEFLRETNYSLSSLSKSQLSYDRIDIDPIDVPKYFSTSLDIIRLAQHTMNDAGLIQRLMLKLQVIPLTKQLTNLSGNLWSRTLRGARAERIEYLLMHEFHSHKYILPEKKWDNSNNNKKSFNDDDEEEGELKVGGHSRIKNKAAYAGGLVLEPKKGLYDTYILLLDFNSLYPSIIQEYNLCFTTIPWTKYMPDDTTNKPTETTTKPSNKQTKKSKTVTNNENKISTVLSDEEQDEDSDHENDVTTSLSNTLPPLPSPNEKSGHLPRVIKTLVDRRREVKTLLKKEKNESIKQQLDIRQKALKLTANSMYGCLGFNFSRFYARPIAALVTAKGREALQRTVDLATRQLGLDVIYGDTDSVMINTNSTDLNHVKELGQQVKKEVNKLYKSLELDLDGIFKSMLLLKKKKYAAVLIKELDNNTITYEKELKGLDLVRRDWCPLSKNTGRYVVDQILSGASRDDIVLSIHNYLNTLAKQIRNNEIDLLEFVITKGLNKNPKDYPDCKGQAHLQVALKMIKDNKPVNIGDHIPYAICVQGPEGSTAPQRAYHPDDVIRSNGELTLDYEWYLSNQILPPISRLCEPIEGTSAAILSAQLGLDATKYSNKSNTSDLIDDNWGFTPKCLLDDSERFKDCKQLLLHCKSCNQEVAMPGILVNTVGSNGLYCQNCGTVYYGREKEADCYSYLSNRVILLIRECIKQYYDAWLVCDDHSCNRRTRQQAVSGYGCTGDCHGKMIPEYSEEMLHVQLKYLESLFDFKRLEKKYENDPIKVELLNNISKDHCHIFDILMKHIQGFAVKDSAYNWIRPSLWTSVFGKSLLMANSNMSNVVVK